METEVQLVIVQVGKKMMALPLEQVEHIAPIENDEEAALSRNSGFFRFQGKAIPWLPLWDFFGETSSFGEIAAFAEILPQRRQDHIDWMAALERSLVHNLPFTKARDPRLCAFGQWYYSLSAQNQPENHWLRALLSTIEEPHARIHSLANKLLNLASDGQLAEAMRIFQKEKANTLSSVLLTFDEIQAALPQLIRMLALIVNDGRDRYALGVDRVLEISRLNTGSISANRDIFGAFASTGFASATVAGNDLLLPILKVEQFLPMNPVLRR